MTQPSKALPSLEEKFERTPTPAKTPPDDLFCFSDSALPTEGEQHRPLLRRSISVIGLDTLDQTRQESPGLLISRLTRKTLAVLLRTRALKHSSSTALLPTPSNPSRTHTPSAPPLIATKAPPTLLSRKSLPGAAAPLPKAPDSSPEEEKKE